MSTEDTKLDALQQGLRVLGDEALIAIAAQGFMAAYLRQLVVGMRLTAPEESAILDNAADVLERTARMMHAAADQPDELIAIALDTISKQRRARMRSVEGGE